MDEVRFYNRSFTDNDVAILYGNGNGDLGLISIITLDVDNSSLTTTGRVEFLKFGVPQSTTGLDPTDFMISGGNLSNLSQNGSGYDLIFPHSPTLPILQSRWMRELHLPANLHRMPFLNLLSMPCFNSPGQFSVAGTPLMI